MRKRDCLLHLLVTLAALVRDTLIFIGLGLRSRSALMAENLFLRKQLALYLERRVKPRHASDATRLTLVLLPGCFPGDFMGVWPTTKHENRVQRAASRVRVNLWYKQPWSAIAWRSGPPSEDIDPALETDPRR